MSRENVEVIGRLHHALAQPDRAGVMDFFDPEVVLTNTPNAPETTPYVGHDGLLAWARSMQEGLGEFRVEADETIDVDESRVIVVARVCGEGRASGLPVEVSSASVYTVKDGRIVSVEAYDTKSEALEAVGLQE